MVKALNNVQVYNSLESPSIYVAEARPYDYSWVKIDWDNRSLGNNSGYNPTDGQAYFMNDQYAYFDAGYQRKSYNGGADYYYVQYAGTYQKIALDPWVDLVMGFAKAKYDSQGRTYVFSTAFAYGYDSNRDFAVVLFSGEESGSLFSYEVGYRRNTATAYYAHAAGINVDNVYVNNLSSTWIAFTFDAAALGLALTFSAVGIATDAAKAKKDENGRTYYYSDVVSYGFRSNGDFGVDFWDGYDDRTLGAAEVGFHKSNSTYSLVNPYLYAEGVYIGLPNEQSQGGYKDDGRRPIADSSWRNTRSTSGDPANGYSFGSFYGPNYGNKSGYYYTIGSGMTVFSVLAPNTSDGGASWFYHDYKNDGQYNTLYDINIGYRGSNQNESRFWISGFNLTLHPNNEIANANSAADGYVNTGKDAAAPKKDETGRTYYYSDAVAVGGRGDGGYSLALFGGREDATILSLDVGYDSGGPTDYYISYWTLTIDNDYVDGWVESSSNLVTVTVDSGKTTTLETVASTQATMAEEQAKAEQDAAQKQAEYKAAAEEQAAQSQAEYEAQKAKTEQDMANQQAALMAEVAKNQADAQYTYDKTMSDLDALQQEYVPTEEDLAQMQDDAVGSVAGMVVSAQATVAGIQEEYIPTEDELAQMQDDTVAAGMGAVAEAQAAVAGIEEEYLPTEQELAQMQEDTMASIMGAVAEAQAQYDAFSEEYVPNEQQLADMQAQMEADAAQAQADAEQEAGKQLEDLDRALTPYGLGVFETVARVDDLQERSGRMIDVFVEAAAGEGTLYGAFEDYLTSRNIDPGSPRVPSNEELFALAEQSTPETMQMVFDFIVAKEYEGLGELVALTEFSHDVAEAIELTELSDLEDMGVPGPGEISVLAEFIDQQNALIYQTSQIFAAETEYFREYVSRNAQYFNEYVDSYVGRYDTSVLTGPVDQTMQEFADSPDGSPLQRLGEVYFEVAG